MTKITAKKFLSIFLCFFNSGLFCMEDQGMQNLMQKFIEFGQTRLNVRPNIQVPCHHKTQDTITNNETQQSKNNFQNQRHNGVPKNYLSKIKAKKKMPSARIKKLIACTKCTTMISKSQEIAHERWHDQLPEYQSICSTCKLAFRCNSRLKQHEDTQDHKYQENSGLKKSSAPNSSILQNANPNTK